MSLVSVPLRGFGYETTTKTYRFSEQFGLEVSVPLRGFGYETGGHAYPVWFGDFRFPSPCGDLVMKRINVAGINPVLDSCFRPLAGIWL